MISIGTYNVNGSDVYIMWFSGCHDLRAHRNRIILWETIVGNNIIMTELSLK